MNPMESSSQMAAQAARKATAIASGRSEISAFHTPYASTVQKAMHLGQLTIGSLCFTVLSIAATSPRWFIATTEKVIIRSLSQSIGLLVYAVATLMLVVIAIWLVHGFVL